MADVNREAEELANLLARINQEMAANGRVSAETQRDYNDALVRSRTGLQNMSKAAASAADSLGGVLGAVNSYGRAMAQGVKGAEASNEAISGLADAAKAAGIMLSLLIPGGPVVKGLIAGFTALSTATAKQIQEANKQADIQNRTFRGLSKSGAIASEGMTGVFQGAQRLGLSMQELDGYVGLINDSSRDLATFAGSAFEGRRIFEDVGQAMIPFQKGLMNLGMSQMEITEGTMGYVRLQARLGQAQNKTTQELAEGARKYLIEQDALTKITGVSRKEQEDQMQRAMMQEQFAAKIRELQMKGDTEAVKRLQDLNVMYGKMGPQAQAGFQAIVSGNLANADAQKLMMSTQGMAMETTQKVIAGQMTSVEAAQASAKAMGQFGDTVGVNLGIVGANNQNFIALNEMMQARIMAENNMVGALDKATAETQRQGAVTGQAADKTTQAYTDMAVAQQKAMLDAQKNIQAQVDRAIEINTSLAGVAQDVTNAMSPLYQVVGQLYDNMVKLVSYIADTILPALEKFTRGLLKITTAKTSEEAVRASGEAGMGETVAGIATGIAGAKFGAAAGALLGPIGAAIGGVLGGAAGYFGGSALGRGADAAAQQQSFMEQLRAMFGMTPPPGRAAGGPVQARSPYIVGERGPELFLPEQSGHILSNRRSMDELSKAMNLLKLQSETLSGKFVKTLNPEKVIPGVEIINQSEIGKLATMFKDFSTGFEGRLDNMLFNSRELSGEYKNYTESVAETNSTIVKDITRFSRIQKSDTDLAETFSTKYKDYIDLKTQILDIEQPLLQQALANLQAAQAQPTVGATGLAAGAGGLGLKAPTAPSLPSMGGAQGIQSQEDLKALGLRIKQGDVQAEDSKVSPKLLDLAQKIQATIPEFRQFTGFNDRFHQVMSPSSKHTQGLAADFTLTQPPTPERGQEISDIIKSMGASLVIDEYNKPSAKATAGHFHVAIPEFEYGGVAKGPDTGYMAKLHGEEAVIPLNNNANNFTKTFEEMNQGIKTLVAMMNESVRAQRNSVDIQSKILKSAY